jgi:hypothetical protein
MSARSFAERYRNLAGLVGTRPERTDVDDGWPLPGGARLRELDGLRYGEHEQIFDDDTVLDAYETLSAASAIPVERYLFLDTETTGLAGGTGTYAFLIGLGRFTADGFSVRQLLMRHPGDELGMLAALEREIDETTTLVTYNGRSFDMPLIETRFRLHHRPPRPFHAHLDLLPQARAIWKHRLPSCALGAIEAQVLGITRELDAPGWLIPSIYFDYLRSRAAHTLEPVLSHNKHDIVSLACIAAHISAYLDGGHDPEHAIDRCAVMLYRLRTRPDEAALEAALTGWQTRMVPTALRATLLREASTILKRRRRHAEAEPVWRAGLSDSSRVIRAFCAEELAKYLEHRARDHAQALALARQAADSARLAHDEELARAFEHRAQRLERKLSLARRADFEEWL